MMQSLGAQTSANLKALMQMNMIRNCSVNTEDVNLADRSSWKDVGSVKGKSTCANHEPITSNLIELLEELLSTQENVAMSVDGLEVNAIKFLTTVSHDSYHRTSQSLGMKPNSLAFAEKLKEIELCYRNGGF